MQIDLQQLRKGDVKLDVNHPPSAFDLGVEDWRFEQAITGEVHFHLCDEDVLARGNIHVEAIGTCVRCLEPVAIGIDVPINYIYQPKSEEPTDDIAHEHVSANAPESAFFDSGLISPLDNLRESILLALPSVPHCSSCEAKRDEPAWSDEPDAAASPDGEPEWKRRLRGMKTGK